MMNTLLSLLSKADVVRLSHPVNVTLAPVTGDPVNQVVHLSWLDPDDGLCGINLTEEGLQNAKFDPVSQLFKVRDAEGDEVCLALFMANGLQLTPAYAVAYVLVQEGGSSTELFVHAHPTRDAAEADRSNCARRGAYRTSAIIEVPTSLVHHPQFYAVAEKLVALPATLGFPDD